jgi:hypothetical protein
MLQLKYNTIIKDGNKNFKITTQWLIEEINSEIKILDKIKSQQKIDDRLDNSGATNKISLGIPCDTQELEEIGEEERMQGKVLLPNNQNARTAHR